jgi:hypothetical protein
MEVLISVQISIARGLNPSLWIFELKLVGKE